jgi:hypothetical protein
MEMAAAAATLGAAGKEWDDERLIRAAKFLTGAMGRDGFPISMPFHTAGGVSYFQPSQQHIIAAYAQILEHVDTVLSPVVLKRIARFLANTRNDIGKDSTAWRWAHADPRPQRHSEAQTAISTIALDRLCRMLDRRINDIVLRHFNRRTPTLRLQELFYPDYGLAMSLGQDTRRVPISIALERMRAHIGSVSLDEPYSERLYSVVFHGPPGTGKTTFAGSAGSFGRCSVRGGHTQRHRHARHRRRGAARPCGAAGLVVPHACGGDLRRVRLGATDARRRAGAAIDPHLPHTQHASEAQDAV